MPLTGEYEPSTSDWARENAELYVQSGGTQGTQLKGKPVVLLTTIGAKSGKLRKTPLMFPIRGATCAAAAARVVSGAPVRLVSDGHRGTQLLSAKMAPTVRGS